MIKLLLIFCLFFNPIKWELKTSEIISVYKDYPISGYLIKGYSDTLVVKQDIWIKGNDTINVLEYNYIGLATNDTIGLRYGILLDNKMTIPKEIIKYYKIKNYIKLHGDKTNYIRFYHKKFKF